MTDNDILDRAPTISSVPNQTLFGESVLGPIRFTVDDDNTAPSLLAVRASSGNQAIVLDENILLGGTGSTRTLLITGINGFGDSVDISLSVADSGGKTGTTVFSIAAFTGSSFVLDNLDSEFSITGPWQESAAVDEFAGSSLFASGLGAQAVFTPRVMEAGNYKLLAWWAGRQSNGASILRSFNAQFVVRHGGEIDSLSVDQSVNSGQWVELGTFRFDGNGEEDVTLSFSEGSSNLPISADAIAFVPLGGGGGEI